MIQCTQHQFYVTNLCTMLTCVFHIVDFSELVKCAGHGCKLLVKGVWWVYFSDLSTVDNSGLI